VIRSVIILALCVQSLFSYSELYLRMQASVLPKLVLMDKSFERKLIKGEMRIAILHEKSEKEDALLVKNAIEKKYRGKIRNYPIHVELIDYAVFKPTKDTATMIYLMDTESSRIKSIMGRLKYQPQITFSYNPDYLAYGVNLSLRVAKRVHPIANFQSFKANSIEPRPTLIEMAERYE